MRGNCRYCGKEINYPPSQGRGFYCSTRCQHDFQYERSVSDWLSKKITGRTKDGRPCGFVRRYLLSKCNYRCSQCGWGEPNPVNGIVYLEIDHIDGSRDNGFEENLRVLCPNCHTLTETYKNLNKNIGYHKGRKLSAQNNFDISYNESSSNEQQTN